MSYQAFSHKRAETAMRREYWRKPRHTSSLLLQRRGVRREKAPLLSTADANKALARRYLELYNTGNPRIADEIIAPDFVDQTRPDLPPGPESVKRVVAALRSAFPDAQATIEQLIAEGNTVALRFVLQSTHQGTFAGVAPTGKLMRLTGMDSMRSVDGRLVELWSSQDSLRWTLQLGLVAWTEAGRSDNV